jgi:aryl-alcohol dehydrogenase-like predicted oxidoreductase
MDKRRLGRSGIEVCALGLGCMEIGGRMRDHEGYLLNDSARDTQHYFFLGEVDDAHSIRAIHYALDMGISLFDTAPAYGAGHSERVLGRALVGKRHDAIIATKFGKFIDEAENIFGRYPHERALIDNIRNECEQSLTRLNTDYIDLFQYHQMDYDLLAYADEVIDILESLVAEGKIRYYGWSTEHSACARMFAQGPHCTAIQHALNLLWETPEMLAVCDTFDQASISRGIMGMGFLNYKTLLSPDDFRLRDEAAFIHTMQQLDKIKAVLMSDGRTIPQGALAWNWARSERTIPIVGFRTLAQVEENIQALDFGPLTDQQMEQIGALLTTV